MYDWKHSANGERSRLRRLNKRHRLSSSMPAVATAARCSWRLRFAPDHQCVNEKTSPAEGQRPGFSQDYSGVFSSEVDAGSREESTSKQGS
jgi:hypothetical protein